MTLASTEKVDFPKKKKQASKQMNKQTRTMKTESPKKTTRRLEESPETKTRNKQNTPKKSNKGEHIQKNLDAPNYCLF